jgi:hypothetical protein
MKLHLIIIPGATTEELALMAQAIDLKWIKVPKNIMLTNQQVFCSFAAKLPIWTRIRVALWCLFSRGNAAEIPTPINSKNPFTLQKK